MYHADTAFLGLLKSYDLPKLEEQAGATYGLWADWRIAYLNPAWFHFAAENDGIPRVTDGWRLGSNLLHAIPPELLDFYRSGYEECLKNHQTWAHDYECSSAERYRQFHQVAYPLGQAEGVLIVNSLIVERSHDLVARPPCVPNRAAYLDPNGYIQQCAHCRMVKRQLQDERWDWVPEWVSYSPKNASHTLCPSCLGYYESKVFWRLPASLAPG